MTDSPIHTGENFRLLRRRFKQNSGANDTEQFRFYGQYFPQLDEFIFKRYFPDINIQGVFVECGANNGQAGSNCKFFEETMHWHGYNLEPTPATFELLKKNRPNSRNICAALSDKRGNINFAITESIADNKQYMGALNCVVNDTLKIGDILQNGQYKVVDILQVPCLSWCEFVVEENICHVDLFILDTEGHEESVIDGMKGSSVLPSVMCVENGLKGGIRTKLEALGYVYDITYHDNCMYVRKDLLSLFTLRATHKNL